MTNASGAGIVLEYRFRDSFCFHIRLAELLGTEMPKLIERLKIFHGEITSVSEPRFAGQVRERARTDLQNLLGPYLCVSDPHA